MFKSFREFKGQSIDKNLEIAVQNLVIEFHRNQVHEGLVRNSIGALTGIALGKYIVKRFLKFFDIKSGLLYDILTSKTILAKIGYEVAKKKR